MKKSVPCHFFLIENDQSYHIKIKKESRHGLHLLQLVRKMISNPHRIARYKRERSNHRAPSVAKARRHREYPGSFNFFRPRVRHEHRVVDKVANVCYF